MDETVEENFTNITPKSVSWVPSGSDVQGSGLSHLFHPRGSEGPSPGLGRSIHPHWPPDTSDYCSMAQFLF